jgi:hypothetical protein
LCSFFWFSSSPFSFFLFISFSCHQDSLSLSSSTFLSSATYHKRSGVMKTCTIHVRQVSLFLHRTDGGAGPVRPLYYFLFFFFFWSQKYLTWSIFLSFALLRIWVFFFWHCVVIGSSLILRAIDAVFIQGRISPIPKYRLYYPLGFRQQLL